MTKSFQDIKLYPKVCLLNAIQMSRMSSADNRFKPNIVFNFDNNHLDRVVSGTDST